MKKQKINFISRVKLLKINIAMWMSYNPKDKNYYFGISFGGIEDMDPSLEIYFVNFMT